MVAYWDGTGVSIQALKAEVIKLGEELPNRRAGCVYSAGGEPVCIVGQAIFNITGKVVNDETWPGTIDSSQKLTKALMGHESVRGENPSEEDFRAYCFVAYAQKHQDVGNSWGEALAYARFTEDQLIEFGHIMNSNADLLRQAGKDY